MEEIETKEIKKIKEKKSQINFSMNEIEDDFGNNSKEKIKIEFRINNGKRDFKYQIKFKDLSNNDSQKSKIEICESPDKPLKLFETIYCYEFGKMQKLSIDLIIKNQAEERIINKAIIIGELIGNNKKNKNNTKIFPINNNEELEISSEILKKKSQFLIIHFYIDISRLKESREEESDQENQANIQLNDKSEISLEKKLAYFQDELNKLFFVIGKCGNIIYESEVFTDDGKFNIVQIPTNYLESDFDIIFYKFKRDDLGRNFANVISIFPTNLNNLVEQQQGKPIYSKNIDLNNILKIYNYSSIGEEITFLDYIKKGGIRIGLNIGIDFTKSNKPPEDENSLHSIANKEQKNPYEKAILDCGKILEYYDYDLLFPVYGFGAVVKNETSYCFHINFKDNPEIFLVDNIILEYHKCIKAIKFSGPTNFAPLINEIISNIKKQNDPREYQVLMILTDGIIKDLEDTIDALVEGSYYPLSVIIIGIGNADFGKMEKLDGDDIPLISRKGIKRQRDLVQFVPYNKYKGDTNRLVYEVLEEIPRQVIEYYTLNYVYPNMLKEGLNGKIKINKINNLKRNVINEGSMSDSNISINNNSYNLNNNQVEINNENESEETSNYELYDIMFQKKKKENVQPNLENNN
jgi:hypothetical protein